MSITQSSHITKLAVRTEALANIKLKPTQEFIVTGNAE